MALLFPAETVDFSVIVIELLLGARDPLLGGSKIDGILIVIRLHCFSFPALEREAADTTKAGASDDTPAAMLVRKHNKATVVHRIFRTGSATGFRMYPPLR